MDKTIITQSKNGIYTTNIPAIKTNDSDNKDFISKVKYRKTNTNEINNSMFYVIQTNTSLVNNMCGDFQSLVYKVQNKTWDEFKNIVLTEGLGLDHELKKSTMLGKLKRQCDIVSEVLINDELHLEVIFECNNCKNDKTITKYYLVTESNFQRLL